MDWPERGTYAYRMLGSDELTRHNAARRRFLDAVDVLVQVKRKEFPARSYGVNAEGGNERRARLLVDFGGLPEGTEYLTEVPSGALEAAVDQFVACFGLDGASGNPAGASFTRTAELDPTPRTHRETEAAPW